MPSTRKFHPLDNPERLSRDFSRIGRFGFWIQLALLIIPLALLIYLLFLRAPEPTRAFAIDFSNYLSIGSLVVLLFTTFWFYRYMVLAKKIADPERRPPREAVTNIVWIGIWAGSIGIFFSMILLLSAVGRLLFNLLTVPPGVMIAPTGGGASVEFVTAADAVTLMSVVIVLAAELIVLGMSIWLLFRATRAGTSGATVET